MRLAGMDGKNLPYSEGVTRYLMMLWMGLGFYIPILSLVMILRSAWRCWKEEPQPWDDGVAYTAKPFRLRYAASLILTVLLVLIVGEAVNSWSQLPPNRGDLTVAEFAENYNRQAEYLDFGGRAYLDEDGQWQEKPEDGSQIISLEDLMDVNPWDDAKAFHYTVEDGHVTAVTMSGTFQNTTAMWVETPDSYVPQIVTALVWGRREAPFWSLSRQAQLREQEEAVTAERRSQVGTGMRNERIRTYNFPQGRLTDHRIGLTLYRLESVMDGDLDEIIDALVTADQAERLRAREQDG